MSTTWLSVDDPTLEMTLAMYASQNLPYTSQIFDQSVPVPLLSPDDVATYDGELFQDLRLEPPTSSRSTSRPDAGSTARAGPSRRPTLPATSSRCCQQIDEAGPLVHGGERVCRLRDLHRLLRPSVRVDQRNRRDLLGDEPVLLGDELMLRLGSALALAAIIVLGTWGASALAADAAPSGATPPPAAPTPASPSRSQLSALSSPSPSPLPASASSPAPVTAASASAIRRTGPAAGGGGPRPAAVRAQGQAGPALRRVRVSLAGRLLQQPWPAHRRHVLRPRAARPRGAAGVRLELARRHGRAGRDAHRIRARQPPAGLARHGGRALLDRLRQADGGRSRRCGPFRAAGVPPRRDPRQRRRDRPVHRRRARLSGLSHAEVFRRGWTPPSPSTSSRAPEPPSGSGARCRRSSAGGTL